jgi:hypothetical protein
MYSLVLLSVLLAACTPAPDTDPPLEPLILTRTRGLRPFDEVILACASPGTPLVIREALPDEIDPEAALRLTWGEPADMPEFVYPVAEDQLVLITHENRSGSALTLDRARALFSGQISDWVEFGGAGEVVLWALMDFNESAAIFNQRVMGSTPVSGGAFLAPDPAAMLAEVSANPNAIGYLPFSWALGNVHVIHTGISLPVLASSAAAPGEAASAWLACMQSAN